MVATNGNMAVVNELVAKYKDVDPFLILKWERIFTLFFDRNCSNNVDWGDFYLVVRKVREVYGAESVQINYARKSLEALWKGLCKIADINRDNLISIDEWIQLLRRVSVMKEKEPKWLDDYQAFMFKLFDVSGDGVLDQAEYADGMSLYGFKYKECMDTFKKFALDNRGNIVEHITPALWKTLFMDLFFSSDKLRPGNLLFGKSIFSKTNPADNKTLDKANSVDKAHSTDKPHSLDKQAKPTANEKPAQIVKSNSQE